MTTRALLHEARFRVQKPAHSWEPLQVRNAWFDEAAAQRLQSLRRELPVPLVLYTYSYAAREQLRVARSLGIPTILGQIDPAEVEQRLVEAASCSHPELHARWSPAPDSYWRRVQQEWNLADRVIVNSSWSCEALLRQGVPASKLRIVPLTYESCIDEPSTADSRFDHHRPLRVLFLGSFGIRKGAAVVLEAVRAALHLPVRFVIAGEILVRIPEEVRKLPNVEFLGAVPRSAADNLYKDADVFLFPTLSDGFGLTQLEASSRGLPLIVSGCCGNVVEDGVSGWVLKQNSSAEILTILSGILNDPKSLAERRRAAYERSREFLPAKILPQLLQVAEELSSPDALRTVGVAHS